MVWYPRRCYVGNPQLQSDIGKTSCQDEPPKIDGKVQHFYRENTLFPIAILDNNMKLP